MEQTFKPDDFVRLTDPLSNGQIVRIENVDEHGFASWLGGSQNCDMEQIEIKVEEEGNPFTDDLREYTVTLSDRVQEIESDFGVKLYPESAVEYWKRRAEIAEESIEKSKDYIKKVCKESSDDIQKLDAENKKLKEELSRCRAANAYYLTAKKEAENRTKILEKDVAASKCDECGKEHQQLAEWLQELEGYKDETPITEEWLNEKFWFDTECEYWDFDTDVNPVEIREIRKNHLYSIFVPHFNYKINVRTRGQLRCFISACGFGDCVKQLKS